MALPLSDVAHLLRRTGFAAPIAVLNTHVAKTREQLVDFVLDFTPNASLPAFQLASNDPYGELIRWWMNRMATAPSPLQERLALCWHDHFATAVGKVEAKRMGPQIEIFQRLGDGNFNELAKAVSLDAAMLIWLDNHTSHTPNPNENFARELLELFLVGANQGYVEADVKAMALAWTGHSVDWDADALKYLFRPTWHDNRPKTLFGVTANWDGPQVLDEMIVQGGALNVMRNRVARFVAVKLWSWFAAPNPSAALADQLGAMLAADPYMNIRIFLRKMFLLDEFYSNEVKTGLVRHPIDWMVSLLRVSGLTDFGPFSGQFGQLDMMPTQPPNVAGWKDNQQWITEPALWGRAQVARLVFKAASSAAPAGTDFLAGMAGMSGPAALQFALDAMGEERIVPGSASWNSLLALFANPHSSLRHNLPRVIALTPEFTLA
jgi:uncharacterized protein (DUF1800 family)